MTESRRQGCRSCLTALAVVAGLVGVIVFLNWPDGAGREVMRGPTCPSQMKALVMAVQAYALDYEAGALPPTDRWQRGPYVAWREDTSGLLKCCEAGNAGDVRHTIDSRWSGMKIDAVPEAASAILLHDAVDGKLPLRHRTYYETRYQRWRNALSRPGLGIGYVDGHCAWRTGVTAEMIERGRDTSLASGK